MKERKEERRGKKGEEKGREKEGRKDGMFSRRLEVFKTHIMNTWCFVFEFLV